MTDRRDYKLPESLAEDFEAFKRDEQTFPAFIREDVIPALEASDGETQSEVTLEATEHEKIAREVAEQLR